MGATFEGRIIDCDATLGVGPDALSLSVEMPWEMIQSARTVGQSVVMRNGAIAIWFETADPESFITAVEGKVATGEDERQPATTKPARRWLGLRRR